MVYARTENRLTLVNEPTRIADHLTAILVGGHSPGEMVLAVRVVKWPIVLVVDAAHFGVQLENGRPFFAFHRPRADARHLCRPTVLARDLDAIVVPGHDARPRERFPYAASSAGRIVVVLG